MGKTYVGNASGVAKVPKKIYAGNSSNVAKAVKVVYCGNSSGKSVEVWRNSTLPSTYQKVQYIYNTGGTQYINTGVKPNSDTRVEIEFMRVNSQAHVFFSADETGAKSYYAGTTNTQNSTIYCYFGGATDFSSDTSLNTKYNLSFNASGGKFYLNNVLQFTLTNTFSASANPILLFGTYYNNAVSKSSDGVYLYRFIVRQGNSIIRDMFPCYLKSNTQTVGMYDLTNGQYYGNSGTGIFYKGPDID